MKLILKRVTRLCDADLFAVMEAVEKELRSRVDVDLDNFPESARRRAMEREQSYRRKAGSCSPPIRAVGLGRASRRRAA